MSQRMDNVFVQIIMVMMIAIIAFYVSLLVIPVNQLKIIV